MRRSPLSVPCVPRPAPAAPSARRRHALDHLDDGTQGVGAETLQFAALEVYGAASGPKTALVAHLGGIPINHTREDFVARLREVTGDVVDMVLDGIGGRSALRSYRALRRGGRLVLFGHSSTLVGGHKSRRKVLAFHGSAGIVLLAGRLKAHRPTRFRQDLVTLFDLALQDRSAPVVAARLPLTEVRHAHELLGQAAVSGKIVLICNDRSPV